MATSEAYLDIVGTLDRHWPPAYDGAIARPCTGCLAAPTELCVNPFTGRPRSMPCKVRLNSA